MRFSPELKRQLREAMLSYMAKKAEAEAQSPAESSGRRLLDLLR
jgi:hypothetical protein